MKLAIIAASLFVSASAMAQTTGVMRFEAVNVPMITLNVTQGEAVLNTGESFDANHVALAKVTSNLDTRATIEVVGTWGELSAFGGVAPAHMIETTFREVGKDVQNAYTDMEFAETYSMSAGVEHDFLMAVRTGKKMTKAGSASFETIIQVSAE